MEDKVSAGMNQGYQIHGSGSRTGLQLEPATHDFVPQIPRLVELFELFEAHNIVHKGYPLVELKLLGCHYGTFLQPDPAANVTYGCIATLSHVENTRLLVMQKGKHSFHNSLRRGKAVELR